MGDKFCYVVSRDGANCVKVDDIALGHDLARTMAKVLRQPCFVMVAATRFDACDVDGQMVAVQSTVRQLPPARTSRPRPDEVPVLR